MTATIVSRKIVLSRLNMGNRKLKKKRLCMHDLKKSCDILGVESANTGVILQTKKG